MYTPRLFLPPLNLFCSISPPSPHLLIKTPSRLGWDHKSNSQRARIKTSHILFHSRKSWSTSCKKSCFLHFPDLRKILIQDFQFSSLAAFLGTMPTPLKK